MRLSQAHRHKRGEAFPLQDTQRKTKQSHILVERAHVTFSAETTECRLSLAERGANKVHSIAWHKVVLNQESALNEDAVVLKLLQTSEAQANCSSHAIAACKAHEKGRRHTTNKLATLPNLPVRVLRSRREITFFCRICNMSVSVVSKNITPTARWAYLSKSRCLRQRHPQTYIACSLGFPPMGQCRDTMSNIWQAHLGQANTTTHSETFVQKCYSNKSKTGAETQDRPRTSWSSVALPAALPTTLKTHDFKSLAGMARF